MTAYAELSEEDQILLAIECIARGTPIPSAVKAALGSELITQIENPKGSPVATGNSQGAKCASDHA